MTDEFKSTKFIASTKEEVFKYFTLPRYLEKWFYPDGMELDVPFYEAKVGGKFQYKHSASEGEFVCDGVIKEMTPDHRLVVVETVKDPSGNTLFSNIQSEIVFKDSHGGTDVFITQGALPDEKMRRECEIGWMQCLDHLSGLFDGRLEPTASQSHVDNQMYKN